MKKFAVIESMTRFECLNFNVRVWREENDLEYDNRDLQKIVKAYETTDWGGYGMRLMIESITGLPRVNAVEVLQKNGDGFVIYPDWP